MFKIIINQNVIARASTKKRALETADRVMQAFALGTVIVKDCKTNETILKNVIERSDPRETEVDHKGNSQENARLV